eukprot:gnl/MRDRNA2_/MRDRNA2_152248_c0_seq1.p1 gnl/MRDRNA2_/MRDRNA2_152248_c0~~gnl/MRDRNA2_/MRDRNA2_152248_c0_seq1.p1  ORF type:complete len:577 (-),score=105.22 gnl/MRDRNA2_/MRDRNA2_152248_c0_seq1:139-1869(-)
MSSGLVTLPPGVLAHAMSFISYKAERISSIGVLCRDAYESMNEDSVWQLLCKSHWYATEERLAQWPSLSACSLYKALEMWVPLEGYYVLTPGFPWGLLVLIRMTAGSVVADVIRFIPNQGGGFTEVSVPLFRVDLLEQRPGVVHSAVEVSWDAGSKEMEISGVDACLLRGRTPAAHRMFPHCASKIVSEGLFSTSHALRVKIQGSDADGVVPAPKAATGGYATGEGIDAVDDADISQEASAGSRTGDDSGAGAGNDTSDVGGGDIDVIVDDNVEDDEDDGEDEFAPFPGFYAQTDAEQAVIAEQIKDLTMLEAWQPGDLCKSEDEARQLTNRMLNEMMGSREVPCDLALLRGPKDFARRDPNFPGIRPGLYVGDYGHDFYGQYRTEVLLIEYTPLTKDELQHEIETPTRIFHRPACSSIAMHFLYRPAEGTPQELQGLLSLDQDVTFIRGIKQCGDFHVPMGATTFVAVAGPAEACAALAGTNTPPTTVGNRQTGTPEAVVRAWRGFGTLAAQGFLGPSWRGGWLLQLQNDTITGEDRFGFIWDDHGNQETVVLHWVHAQDTSPFLQRAWLPSALQ